MSSSLIGDQFTGLPMAALIGAPLMAACDAQIKLANATANFIKVVGFNEPTSKDADGVGTVRTAKFSFERPSGPASDEGVIPTETVSLEVPLLAVVKIPSLGITQVDVTFDMEVKSSETSKESQDSDAKLAGDAKIGWGIFSLNVHVEGSVSSHQEHTRSSDQSAKYHVQVQAQDQGMPEGLARVLDIIQSSIAPKVVTLPRSGGSSGGSPGDKKSE